MNIEIRPGGSRGRLADDRRVQLPSGPWRAKASDLDRPAHVDPGSGEPFWTKPRAKGRYSRSPLAEGRNRRPQMMQHLRVERLGANGENLGGLQSVYVYPGL